MPKQLSYDYSLMMKEAVGSKGIGEKKLAKLQPRLKAVHSEAHAFMDSGEQGFIQTLFDTSESKLIREQAQLFQKKFKQLLVIGIGGSDLGARALQSLFAKKTTKLEVFFLGDTTDPIEIERVCKQIDWKHCAVNPVSKSGNTVEPLSVFFYVQQQLIKAVGKKNHAKHVFVTTEDKQSIFHQLVQKHGYTLIPHPFSIGGRWTVLSVVGLVSAEASGIATSQLRKGARDYYLSASKKTMNPSLIYAALHYLGIQQNQSLAVLMPYAADLEEFGGWYRQLFAESLGKEKNRKGKKVYTGLTPLAANGPKDQHSQVQLYNSGPFDKLITFIRVQQDQAKLSIPAVAKEEASFLSQKSFHEILGIEQEATALALANHKRPSGTILLPDMSEYTIGQLFCFFELACVYLAELLDINAFDQPGVEEGKNNMYALLGKPGYAEFKKKMQAQKKAIRKYIVS